MIIKKKLLKNFLVQQILAFIVALYIFLVRITSRIKFVNKSIPKSFWQNNKPFILAFWHSQLMMISYTWKSPKRINILASGHSDGRFGSIVGKYFKLNNISISHKESNLALRPIYQKLKSKNYVGITPDGPRGPKEIVSEGIVKIARATKTPIIACGFWSSKNFCLKSWDSFLVTLPFSSCCFVWGKPLYISQDTKDNEIEHYQNILKKMIDDSVNNAKKNI
jgi:hypothetical protein